MTLYASAVDGAPLTPREREVLLLMVRGFNKRDGSAQLGIRPLTYGDHQKAIYAKLGVNSAGEACYVAGKRGVV